MSVTPKNIIAGDDLMVFLNGASIAYATAHTLTLSSETASINSKDHGVWSGNEVNKRSWSISSENLYTDEDFATLYDAWAAGNKLTLVWGKKAEASTVVVADGDAANYTPNETTANYWTGSAYITSLTANANTGEKATFSVEFTGTGAFSKNGEISTPDTPNTPGGTTYTVTLTAGNHINSVSGNGTYSAGDSVTISATLSNGMYFNGWYNGITLVSSNNPYTFTMPSSNVSYTAMGDEGNVND